MSKFWKWFKFYILGQPAILRFGDNYMVMKWTNGDRVAYDRNLDYWADSKYQAAFCLCDFKEAQEILRKVKINGEIL